MKLSPEEREAIQYAMLDDSTKVISYLEELEERRKPAERLTLLLSAAGVVLSAVAAVTGIIALLK